MSKLPRPIIYRLVGHVANDLTPTSIRLGGTVAYAGLTAAALEADVGILTACGSDINLDPLKDIALITIPSPTSTVFENRETASGRSQKIISRARELSLDLIPPDWHQADIIHLAPIADEIELDLYQSLPCERLFMTPQGWLREWDENGNVRRKSWSIIREPLSAARAVVCSLEDLAHDLDSAAKLAQEISLLVITRSELGAWLFVNGKKHVIDGLEMGEVDSTGSGDIFAAVFFMALSAGLDPYQAAQQANTLAAYSVTRRGLESPPNQLEIETARGS